MGRRTEIRAVNGITVSYGQGVSLDITDVYLETIRISLEDVAIKVTPARDGTYVELEWISTILPFPLGPPPYVVKAIILVRTGEQKRQWEQYFQEAKERLQQAHAPRDVEPPVAVAATS